MTEPTCCWAPDTERIHRLLAEGVREHVYPGAVWAVGDAGGRLTGGAVGVPDPRRPERPMRADTLFDLASLTKVLAVWSVLGALWEDGRLPLDQPIGSYWPEPAGHPLGRVTARQLLTHTAGVPLRTQLEALYGRDPAAIRTGVLRAAPHRPPGEAVEYTDRAALILGYLVEHLTGERLDRHVTERIWDPLGMHATRFGPLPAAAAARCAPTELDQASGEHWQGTVHDPSARLLGGVCGIAGVFSTADDLGVYLRHLLAPGAGRTTGGRAGADRVGVGAAWTAESLRVQTGRLEPQRGLFWHLAPGTGPAEGVWTHYGFTGTALWLVPGLGRWAVLLTNKVFWTRERQPLTDIRNAFRALVCA
ncbi:serine hydrolase domain-containing protein [Kitasatospora sp. NBC_01302]|uniref:serine hydrolase domain-containing protein n=1 Tax=Kitasatospora sp. NBC_01302 TaxID=2903575 RepID=UPI002E10E689|nr:beta-lactamase family protein [Kitasatospora sp. NBC_01302]